MRILAVDSTTEACSVALLDTNKPHTIAEQYQLAPREHSQRLLPMVDQVLAGNNVDIKSLSAIAFAKGPGSFTGLRICLGLVQGLAYGANLPVIPVSSLQALAQTGLDTGLVNEHDAVIASIDARMSEIYWCAYQSEQGIMMPLVSEYLTAPSDLVKPVGVGDFVGLGNGWQYREQIPGENNRLCHDQLLPRASAVAKIALQQFNNGETCTAEQAQPTYIRDQVAWKKLSEQ